MTCHYSLHGLALTPEAGMKRKQASDYDQQLLDLYDDEPLQFFPETLRH